MAESYDKIPPSNRRINFLLSCFGSSPKVRRQTNPATVRRVTSIWFRFKKSSATVPADAAVPEITESCDDKASFSPEFKKPSITFSAPAVRTEIVETIKPILFDSAAEIFPPAKRTAALLHSVSFPSRRLNRQKDLKKTASPLPAVETPTPASSERRRPAEKQMMDSPAKKFDAAIVIVAVAIVALWGRLGAILCTTALFYLCRRLRSEFESEGGG